MLILLCWLRVTLTTCWIYWVNSNTLWTLISCVSFSFIMLIVECLKLHGWLTFCFCWAMLPQTITDRFLRGIWKHNVCKWSTWRHVRWEIVGFLHLGFCATTIPSLQGASALKHTSKVNKNSGRPKGNLELNDLFKTNCCYERITRAIMSVHWWFHVSAHRSPREATQSPGKVSTCPSSYKVCLSRHRTLEPDIQRPQKSQAPLIPFVDSMV